MADHGLFDGQRYELVEGDLISKMGHNPPHAYFISVITAALAGWFGDRARVQLSLVINDRNEPQPDFAVTREPARQYADRFLAPGDVMWLIEVSDSTLKFDLTTKADLYARAAISDYWVMDLVNRRIVLHRDPRDGKYLSVATYAGDEAIAPLMAPDRPMRFAALAV